MAQPSRRPWFDLVTFVCHGRGDQGIKQHAGRLLSNNDKTSFVSFEDQCLIPLWCETTARCRSRSSSSTVRIVIFIGAAVGGGGNSFRGRRRHFDVDISPNIPLQDGILRIKKFTFFDIQENSIPVFLMLMKIMIIVMMMMMMIVGETVLVVHSLLLVVVPVHACRGSDLDNPGGGGGSGNGIGMGAVIKVQVVGVEPIPRPNL